VFVQSRRNPWENHIMQARHLLSAAVVALGFCATAAFAAEPCRTVANGVQKCDVQTGGETSRDAVVANMHAAPSADATGCRTIANGVQKCDVPTGVERSRASVVADVQSGAARTNDGCRTIANGVMKCDVPTAERSRTAGTATPPQP